MPEPAQPQINWQPISELPLIASMIDGLLEDTQEQYKSLEACRFQPDVLDDYTVGRVIGLYTERMEFLAIYEEQLAKWRKLNLNTQQRREIERLAVLVKRNQERVPAVLALAAELSTGTIDTIMTMDPAELAMEILLGIRKPAEETKTRRPRTKERRTNSDRNDPPPAQVVEANRTGNLHPLRNRLTVNEEFIEDLLSTDGPCFGLGLAEERKELCGFLALRPGVLIPGQVTQKGFRFGHSLIGTSAFEVVHFAFEFYGFGSYNALVNPSDPVVQTVLKTMVGRSDYFFFVINAEGSATAFRSVLGQEDLAGLNTNLPRILRSTTTEAQYDRALAAFVKRPDPPGTLVEWVCRDKVEYLDLSEKRLELTPA